MKGKKRLILSITILFSSPAHAKEVPHKVIETIIFESSDQPFEGQVAVASVIRNRARERKQSLLQVIFTPKAFSCWNSKRLGGNHHRKYTMEEYMTAYRAWELSETMGINANLYCKYNFRPSWRKTAKFVARYGSHIFMREG